MNIKFKEVILNNFMSFGHSDLLIDEMGIVLVSGKNHNQKDNALSNGSGKSTLFNAICYALTGETIQGLSNNLENIYADPNDCWVELHFSVDSDDFVLKRIKTPKSDLKIYINGEDKSGKGIAESRQLLLQYLPDMNSQLLGSIIILGQGLPHRFTDNKPSHRKELLENLTKSDYMIQSIKDKLEIRQMELKNNLRSKEDSLISNNTQIDIYTKQLQSLSSSLEEYDQYDSEYKLDDRISYLNNKLSLIDNDLIMIDKDRVLNNSNLNLLTSDKERLLSESRNKFNDLTKPYNDKYSEIEKQLFIEEASCKSLKSEINKLKDITDICPTCGQKIPGAKIFDTSNIEKDLLDKIKIIENLSLSKESILSEKKTVEESFESELNISIGVIDDKISDINKVLLGLTELYQSKIEKKNKTIKEIEKVNNMKDNYNRTVNEISHINETLLKLDDEKTELNLDISEINSHLSVIQSLITLAKREFRGVLLQSVIEYINKNVKKYSIDVFGNDFLSFELNENNIDITFQGKPYENLSGGEKQKVDLIVQLALRELLSNQLNIHCNIIVFDEVFDNLDNLGCQKILELINKINDISSIFIITHHKESLEISYDVEIVINKDNSGISSVQMS